METVTYPAAQLYAQAAGKVSVRNRLPAQRIFTTPAGETVVDFGQNMAGRVEITATGGPGDVAELLRHKPLDKITVSDLTDHCGVNRMPFY